MTTLAKMVEQVSKMWEVNPHGDRFVDALIELEAAVADLKPVAWRVRDFADGWILFENEAKAKAYVEVTGVLMQPLYAAL